MLRFEVATNKTIDLLYDADGNRIVSVNRSPIAPALDFERRVMR